MQGEKPRVNRKPGGMGEGNEMMNNIRRQAVARGRGKPIDEERENQNQIKAKLVEEREIFVKRTRVSARNNVSKFNSILRQISVSEVATHEL